MEPVTHILTGAVLARAGLNRRAAYTTAAMALAAEFPDIDTVWSLRGPLEGFQHHRGLTHSFLGLPFEAAIILAAFWGIHSWRRRSSYPVAGVGGSSALADARALPPKAPVRWGLLYSFILLALLSHIALDWTNNYGVRPLFPFDPRWHAGSLLFIFDPLVFVLLVSALVLPSLFRLVGSEVGAASAGFAPRRWAIGSLACILALLGLRMAEHERAVSIAFDQSVEATSSEQQPSAAPLTPSKAQASPDPFSPFRWHVAVDFGRFLQLMEIDTRRGLVAMGDDRLDKPAPSQVLERARQSPLGRIYLDWSPMPALSVSEGSSGEPGDGGAASTVVFFRDPRFMGAVPLLNRSGLTPLTGTVELDRQNRVINQTMDGRAEPVR